MGSRQGEPSSHDEASLRAMLEKSRRDIDEGRTVPVSRVLDRMRAMAEAIRRERVKKAETDRRRA